MFQTPHPWTTAALAAIALAACSGEPPAQVSVGSPDAANCKARMALPENAGCDLYVEFGPAGAPAGPTRRAAVQAWLAANPWAVAQTREGAGGRPSLCLTTPFERDTDAAYEALKAVGSTATAGSMRLCTDNGHSFLASDPVDHGGDEVKR